MAETSTAAGAIDTEFADFQNQALMDAPHAGAGDGKVLSHEDAAHEKRNWVRLSYDCNNHCTFCLDSNAHDGTMRANMDIKVQIVEGRKKGAERLILSGGEPTMHPNFIDFVKLGKRAGYPKVQTVTNGRMFKYPEFLAKGRQIGSGPTEAMCKTTTRRLKGSGMRWDGPNAEAVMTLAGLDQSDAWKDYWRIRLKQAG